ncbi:MAG: KH domain-containing protein [Elusimicrobiota bacterium]|nr:KH domain-containing protein [Elusimicrobiota bacterium]
MKDLTQFIVSRLADKPGAVKVEESLDGDLTVLTLLVDEGDKGKVIGKQGKVIKAIRALVAVAAQKEGKRAVVEID